MSLNSFFTDSSGSLFFISGSYELSSSISTSLEPDPETGSLLITQSFITNTFPDPSTNAFAVFQLDPNDPTSFIITGSKVSSFYMSSSGRLGFGTDDPLVAFDVRADEFQIQKTSKRQGVRVNEEGNIESFNSEADAAATGSEFILTYAVGGASKVTSAFLQTLGFGSDAITAAGGATAFFNSRRRREQQKILFLLEKQSGLLDIASVGDVLGSIRWVAASGSDDTFNKRVSGEAGNIKLTVASSTNQGVTGKLSFNLPADEGAASQQLYSINGSTQKHEFTGSGGFHFTNDATFNGTNLNLKKDSAVLKFGADLDTTFTHVHNAGVTLNADRSIFFRDAAIGVSSQTDGFLELKADKGIEITKPITASGEISASGNIKGLGYFIEGNILADMAGSTIALGYQNNTPIQMGRSANPLRIVGNLTASGAISSSGVITSDDGSGNGFTVRPNLYFFATNTSAITMGGGSDFGSGGTDNQGSLPATNTTTITLSQEQNSHTGVFSLSSNRVTIARAGLYKMTYNALLEINNGSNRAEGFVGLVQETSGGSVSLVDGTEGRGYHRFVHSTRPSSQTYAASVIVNVAANSIYDLRFGLIKQSVATQKLRTIDTGTSFLVEAIT